MSEPDAPDETLVDELAHQPGAASNYHKLLTAATAGNLADGIFKFALPIMAVSITGNPILVGGVTAALSLPWLLVSLPAGALADRIDRLKTMVRANAVRVLVLALIMLSLLVHVHSLLILYLGALALGLAEVMFETSAQAILPTLVGRDAIGRANARLYTIEFLMNELLGKALGGWLAGIALSLAFGFSAVAYLCAAVALFLIVGEFRAERGEPTKLRTDIAEGVRFMWHQKFLRNLALTLSIIEFLYEGVLAVLPLFALAVRHGPLGLSTRGYGLLLASMAIGGLLASAIATRFEKLNPVKVMCGCALIIAGQVAALAFTHNLVVIIALFIPSGAASLLFTIASVTLRQTLIPDTLLGRVNSCYRLVIYGSISLGALAGGIIVKLTSIHTFYVAATIIIGVVSLLILTLTSTYNNTIANQ